jgi:CHAT domain-containing protein
MEWYSHRESPSYLISSLPEWLLEESRHYTGTLSFFARRARGDALTRWIWATISLLAIAILFGVLAAAPVRKPGKDQRFEGRLLSVEHLSADSGSSTLHKRGRQQLAKDHFDAAILTLEETARRAARKAEALSDLSAALLARAKAEARPLDLIRALDAANRALTESPRLPEALFNRAKALTRLHLRRQAQRAWQVYLDVEPKSTWAPEAQEYLRDLSEPTLEEQWDRQLPRLLEAVRRKESTAIQEIVTRFPQSARLLAEEKILPSWGEAFRQGDFKKATYHLAVAREIGNALLVVTRDSMVADSVSAIDQAQKMGRTDQLSLLAGGHDSFGKGMELYRSRQELNEARPLLASSARLLGSARSPFAGWADFYLGVCGHYGGPADSQIFQALAARVAADRYPILSGVVAWMRGTMEHNLGRPESALRLFRTAYARLDGASHQESPFVHVLIAEAYETLGEVEGAWRERLAALDWVSRSGDRRKLHSSLHEAASALLLEGSPATAPDFLAELLDNDQASHNPGMLTETYLLRGRTFDLLGHASEALESFRAAQDQAAAMAASAQKERIASMLSLAEGEAFTQHDPDEAVRTLTAALASDRRQEFLYQLTPILTARARAYEALGDFPHAEADLRQALAEHERVRGSVHDEQLRLSYFERSQDAFNEMIRLQTDHLGDPIQGFDFAERARARVLRDLTLEHEEFQLPEVLTGKTLKIRLPPGITLVEYALLPDRLLAWVVDQSAIHPISVRLPESVVEQEVENLRSSVERRAHVEEFRTAAATLYRLLIQPLAPYLPAKGRLVFVPDRVLVQVPFAALFDPSRDRYLAQDWSVSIAPSATLYIMATGELRRFGRDNAWNALVVGDPAFDRERYLTLPRLADAAAEAAEVAALYKHSALLMGEAATRSSFVANAGNYRLIHFAGHALLHPTSPRLSHLLFAPDADSPSGALYASEIATRRLANTEVVVLSACRAIADNQGSRESLTGLAAAFLAAGPPVVVSSLWNVDDHPTRQLMQRFHRALRRGEDPGDALRLAQLDLLQSSDEALRSPASWAGFEAIGGVFSNQE